ncbi:MAG: MBL fold metallo-hydrolase, partial [Fimbriiglobus sp.]
MTTRRDFLRIAAAAPAAGVLAGLAPAAPAMGFPRITFYGSTRQVSGSCHLLETSHGLYVIDCGLFISDVADPAAENRDLPFDPKDVKALFLTHAHTDHHGRLPLLYKKGFRGTIYCTDATRDMTTVALGGPTYETDDEPLYDKKDATGVLKLLKAVPYNQKFDADKLTVRYTDAGHILGSAMAEIWADGRKLLFSGDMGPDTAPILCRPAQHYTADAVLVESTYGPVPRATINYEDFGKKVAAVLKRGGDVLIPSFAVHQSQLLIFTLHKLAADGIIPKDAPIYCDSSTAHKCNLIYDAYPEYFDDSAKEFATKHGSLFYRGKYREGRANDFLTTHGGTPGVYISTSGMIEHAAAPR